MTKIIFWDYDGTLVDTETIYKRSIISFLKENKLLLKDIEDEFFYKYIAGHHPGAFIAKLKEYEIIANLEDINAFNIGEYYNTFFSNLKPGDIKIIDNIDKIIEKLMKFDDIIMCITSSSFKNDFMIKSNNINNKILNSCFNINKNVYLCNTTKGILCKPNPDIFNYAFNNIKKQYNLNTTQNDQLFIIEDSEAGCKAGKSFKIENGDKINVKIVGFTAGMKVDNYKQEYKNKLLSVGADTIIDETESLFKFITN